MATVNDNTDRQGSSRAPVIKYFGINGLHGYKDIRLEFSDPIKIVIAENGAGKTTILSALAAFLQRDFTKLSNLDFESIECDVDGLQEPLVLKKSHIAAIQEDCASMLAEFASYAAVDVAQISQVLLQNISDENDIRFESPLIRDIYLNSPYDRLETSTKMRELKISLEQSYTDDVKFIISKLKDALDKYDVLYLPTYRRIERPLSAGDSRYGRAKAMRLRHAQMGRRTLNSGRIGNSNDINFGLADVEQRLTEITNLIQIRSNIGYRKISAEIIDDLISGRFPGKELDPQSLPKMDDLRLFFSRIEQSSSDSESRLAAVAKLYETKEIEGTEQSYLRYFLTMLSNVVKHTKQLEANIEQFVDKANVYLKMSSDEKVLKYDANKMKVLVQNTWTGASVKFDDLSSGEKQVISLFAHMYLDSRNKIVLIDEPELSLSIDWQRRLLPDVVKAPNCSQLLAITHSPFIFDNDLDPFAGPLRVERNRRSKE